MSVLEIIKRNFENEVIFSDRPGILLYTSSSQGDWRELYSVIEEIADENVGIKVCVVDLDRDPELAKRFAVTGTPTLLILKNGKERFRSLEVLQKEKILEMLQA